MWTWLICLHLEKLLSAPLEATNGNMNPVEGIFYISADHTETLIHMKTCLVSEMNLMGKSLCFKFFTNKDNQCH